MLATRNFSTRNLIKKTGDAAATANSTPAATTTVSKVNFNYSKWIINLIFLNKKNKNFGQNVLFIIQNFISENTI